MSVSASEFQVIRNGIHFVLTACGPYANADVSACDFGILDSTSGCAVLFMPGTSTFVPIAYGRNNVREDQRLWGVGGQIWVKDTGDPVTFNGRIWQACDDFYSTLNKDATLNNSCKDARVAQMNYVADGDDRQGQHWGVVGWTLIAETFG